ncbi:NACHT domain-containing protein [Oscillatoria sp. HE19RPO]|uniref:NACHT C-terminal alpha/beta 1 domain-containing protein n=1 Tax=Oscillatoria sp. HE19RPO TaxID=2954806 RepID=UPI0020C3AB93|nr:NACHT domain-containing protein [Oscillatoria sp. HE19RPO]
MSEPTNQNTGSQGNQGQQGNVAGVNYGVQNTYVGVTTQQRQIDRDICRKMLEGQVQLTSNTVVGQVYGNRNLIDEDLFVDLALVKPKRSQNQKHPQEIDPEKGSDLFTRQEVEKRFAYREFLQEVIRQRTEKCLAIIGEPGAGKTTLLQKLAFWLLQETDDLVVWVSLAELGSQPLAEYLEQKWLKEALGQSREEIKADWEQKFKGGAVWLLLDGLDEMSQTDQQALKLRGWVTDARMIVTCRLNLWQANPSQLQGFQTYLTQPFQDEQMQEFIRRWFRGLVAEGEDVQLAEFLWSELQESGKERIKDLCRNPLRLTLLCSTWTGRNRKLPDTTAKLYEKFVNYIYHWKKQEFPVRSEERKQLNTALGELAKISLDGERSRFRLSHRLVCEYLGEPDENSLLDTALKLGWLNKVGEDADEPEDPVYGFYHATFQEYFAALAVPNWDYFLPRNHVDCPVKGKRYRIFEPQWKQVILLWLGREDIKAQEKEGFIWALVEFEDGCAEWNFEEVGRGFVEFEDGCAEWNFEEVDRGFYEYRAYFLAAAGINEFKACSLAAQIVRQLVKWRFGSFNIEKQEWIRFNHQITIRAIKAISETIRRLVITELRAIIENGSDKDILIDAAESLGKIDPRNPEAIAGLRQIIRMTDNESTRKMAARSLWEIDPGNPEAIKSEIEVIHIHLPNFDSSDNLDFGKAEDIPALLKFLCTSENEHEDLYYIEGMILEHILSTQEQYAWVVSALKNCLSDEVYQNGFSRSRSRAFYSILWVCAENLPYPQFHQAWHHPPITPHPEVTEQTPHSGEPSFASPLTWESLQHLPIYCLNADLLANETREGEIALTLSELIWEITCPEEDLPEPATPAELRRHLKSLKRGNLLPYGAILFGGETFSTPTKPIPELMAFCQKLTGVIAVAFLTDEPLDPPLKGFPPNQSNLISAIETWLGEI